MSKHPCRWSIATVIESPAAPICATVSSFCAADNHAATIWYISIKLYKRINGYVGIEGSWQ